MSYQKKVWVTKEVIYGKDLNHIEDGIYNIDQQLSQQSETVNKAYLSTDSSSSDLADNDYIPFYDSSAGSRKKVQYSVLKTSIGGDYAPKNHATSATTYGKGSTSNFGHLKISDSYTSSAGSASDGVSASSKALNDAYNTLNSNKYDKSATYSKTEVDNLLSSIETNIEWKESVATYADIATTYPNPQDGWTVNVNDTDYTYRYDGVAWIAISANAIPDATTSVKGLMTTTMVTKLNGIAEGAEVNQNAFSNVVVGSTTLSADSKTDTLTLVAGTNVTLTPDATNDKITITTTNTTYSAGVGLSLSSTTLKARLKSETQSSLTAATRGSTADREYAVGVDAQGNLSVNVPWTDNNTTYSAGTGLSFSGTTINHSNSVTAGTAKGDDSKTLTFGGTFTIPTVAYDSQGHVTAKGTTTMTMPTNPNVWTALVGATSSANGSVGYINAVPPKSGYNTKFFRADGTWAVPAGTTYESKAAASGGTDVSLCTTGEKYTWNSKSSLALGETSSTAYRGDRGKTAYTHSQTTSGNPHNVTASDVGLGNVGNYKAVSTESSQGLTDTEKSNARANIGAGTSSLALGTSSSTAYRGDRGNSAYAHAVTNKGSAFASGLYKITTNAEGHVTAATAVVKSDITDLGIPGSATDSTKLPLAGGTLTGRLTIAKPIKQIITGSGTAATTSGDDYVPAKWTFNTGITAATGDIVTIKVPVAGHSYGVYMSIDNATTYYPVVTNGTTRLTTQYPKGTYLMLQLDTASSCADIFPLAGGTARETVTGGAWRVVNYYDSNTTYSSKAAESGGTATSLCTTGEKYTWNSKANGNHTHTTTIATSSGTNQLTMAANTKYAITAGGTSYVFTTPPDNNTRDFKKGTSRSGATADVLYFVYTT